MSPDLIAVVLMTVTDRVNKAMHLIEDKRSLHFSFLHKVRVWWMARMRPVGKGQPLPLGLLDPGIARIQNWTDEKMHIAAQLWASEVSSIGVALRGAYLAIAAGETELAKRDDEVTKQEDLFFRSYGHEAEPGFSLTDVGRWLRLGIFAVGEMPLMSAAMSRLPNVLDWQRYLATAAVSILTLAFAIQLGTWLRRRDRTIAQSVSCVLIGLLLGTIVFVAAEMRSSATLDQANGPEISVTEP